MPIKPCCDTDHLAAAGNFIFIQSPITLTETPQSIPLVNAVGARQLDQKGTNPNNTFGLNGNNIIIREPGVYNINTFVEFTIPEVQAGFLGVRTYSVTGTPFTRRLWLYKGPQTIPEYAGSVDGMLVSYPGQTTELQIDAFENSENPVTSQNLNRIYAEITITRLSGLAGAGPIT